MRLALIVVLGIAACTTPERAPPAASTTPAPSATLAASATHDASAPPDASLNDVVGPTIARVRAKLVSCYETGLARDRSIRGTASLMASVDAAGRPTNIVVVGATGIPQGVVDCAKAVLSKADFTPPPPDGAVPITLRFIAPNEYDGPIVEDGSKPHDVGY